MPTRKRKPRNKKRSTRRMYGGEKIAAGTYGCVYKPPLRCQGSETRHSDSISKFLNKKKAKEEYEQYQLMNRIDPHRRFHLGIHDMCIPAEPDPTMNEDFRKDCSRIWKEGTSLNDYRILNEPDGGFELSDMRQQLVFTRKRPKKPIHSEKWNTFFRGMERILYGLVQFRKHGFVHQDIKGDNIVIDPNTLRFNYIDFGMLNKRTNIIQSILHPTTKKYRFYKVDFFLYYPPELFVLSNYPERYKLLMQTSFSRPEKANQMYEDLKKLYTTTLQTSEDKHVTNVREIDAENMDAMYRRSQFRFPDTLDEYFKTFSSGKLNEIIEKWDIYSLGYTLALLWKLYFGRPFTEEILPPPYHKHPFMEFRNIIAKMISLDYRERLSPDEVYSMYRSAYKNLFETTLNPLYPSLRMVPPMIDRGSHSVSTSMSSTSSTSTSASSQKSQKSRKSSRGAIPSVSIPIGRLEMNLDRPRRSRKSKSSKTTKSRERRKSSSKTVRIDSSQSRKTRQPVFSVIKKPSTTRRRKPTRTPVRTSPPMTRNRRRRLGLKL